MVSNWTRVPKCTKGYQIEPHKISSLDKPTKGGPSYSTLDKSLGPLFVQENGENKEKALYYLSQIFVRPKERYSLIQKMCLALIFVIQTLRHYIQHHSTKPFKYILR